MRPIETRVRRSFDEAHFIAATTDQRRGWSYFEPIVETSGVAPRERVPNFAVSDASTR